MLEKTEIPGQDNAATQKSRNKFGLLGCTGSRRGGQKGHSALRVHCSPRPAVASRDGSRGDLCRNCAVPAGSPSSDPPTASHTPPPHLSRGAACDKTRPRISRPGTGARFRFRGAHAATHTPLPVLTRPPALGRPRRGWTRKLGARRERQSRGLLKPKAS